MKTCVHGQRGVALIAATLAITLLLALGATLILVTSSETAIAGNFRTRSEALYAAAAVVERTIAELRDLGDWTLVLNGSVASSVTDGAPSGQRRLPDGTTIDLGSLLNLANCGRAGMCRDADMNAVSSERPWGTNNPRWRLFTYGTLDDLAGPPSQGSPYYVLSMVADDGAESDGDPTRDGATAGGLPNPGWRVVMIRGEAFGPRGAHRAVEAVIAAYRMDELDPVSPLRIHIRTWQEF